VRIGLRARRDDDDVHRQAARADRLARDADEVRQALLRQHFALGSDRATSGGASSFMARLPSDRGSFGGCRRQAGFG
jgi:hypothetical protein